MTTKPNPARWANVIRGCAYGDAWGDPNEFKHIAQLTAEGEAGPRMPYQLRITDDTQMSLSLARALNRAGTSSIQAIRGRVLDEWVRWYHDPDNNRAPGMQCMTATGRLARGAEWMDATDSRNDGCGTVMRNHATAFLPDELYLPVAAWQAITTHGGTNGVAACMVEAATLRLAAAGKVEPGKLTETALQVAKELQTSKRLEKVGKWLAWAPAIWSDDFEIQEAWLVDGLKTMEARLQHCVDELPNLQGDPWGCDPCNIGGQGWRAHECLATALVAADSFPNNPILSLRRATVTNGDSDSIAAVTGALLGAVHENPWPSGWFDRIEPRYQTWIRQASKYTFDTEEKDA